MKTLDEKKLENKPDSIIYRSKDHSMMNYQLTRQLPIY